MKTKIPTILAVLILMFAVAAGVFLVQNNQVFRIGASPEAAPQDVRVTNTGSSSVSISWTTDKATVGTIVWGDRVNQVDKKLPSTETEGQNVHLINLTDLTPETTYYFKVVSDGTEYDNSGIPWQTTTGPTLATPTQQTQIMSGKVLTATGEPASRALVYITGSGMSPLATQTTATGSWVIQVSEARTSDLNSFFNLTTNPVVQIFVQAGPSGVASATAKTNLDPVPDMILGKTYDFTTQTNPEDSNVPDVDLNIPEETTPSSKFNISESTASPTPVKTVTISNVKEDEVITTTEPEFFGQGPAGTTITISVHSEVPVTGTTKVSSTGTWSWTPPEGLAPGEHTITITWKDAQGVLQSLTRTFVVQAAEGPAFVATPSASPKTSATPKATATASATPRVTIPSTESGIPKTGTGTPTMIGIVMGIVLIIGAFILAL